LTNALCVDVDDLSESNAEAGVTMRERRFTADLEFDSLLGELDRLSLRATLFFPSLFANKAAHLVKRAAELGHEVASHGDRHQRVKQFDRGEFLADVTRSKALLEDITGDLVDTYKAPLWSITPQCAWAHDKLREAGFAVDHSAMPALKKHLGYPAARMEPFRLDNGLLVIPVTTCRVFGVAVPFPGGFYNAYVPFALQRKIYFGHNQRGLPFNFYFHPYEHSPTRQNRQLIKNRSLFLTLYAAHNGRYKSLLAKVAASYSLGTLRQAYARWYLAA
jgi:polysaccharide deacetylase family protein (PEP-CTERM system associated)